MRNFSSLLLSSPFLSNLLRRLPARFSGLLKTKQGGCLHYSRLATMEMRGCGGFGLFIDRSVSQSIKRTTSPLFCNYGWCGRGEGWGGGMGWDGILCVHVDLLFYDAHVHVYGFFWSGSACCLNHLSFLSLSPWHSSSSCLSLSRLRLMKTFGGRGGD